MSGHTTTTLAFVRTDAGVVRVAEGERIPDDTLDTEITRLVAAGVLVETEPEQGQEAGAQAGPVDPPSAPDEAPATSQRARGKSRGQSGSQES